MKKNGFTLIELLAVIIILGILMIIAIPSVTKYISDSRKNAYIDTAKEIIAGARNLVNEGKLEMYDTNTTYYIPSNCIKTENASKSPYGEFIKDKTYVVVTYDGKGYSYYWVSLDDAGEGVSELKSIDELDTDDIKSDLTRDDIRDDIGVGGREKVTIFNETCTGKIDKDAYKDVVCKRATILHEETCERTSSGCLDAGYSTNGSKGTNKITYGSKGTKGELHPGDAFDCDVNGDETFDPETERFYYISQKTINSKNYATLIYYTNVYNGQITTNNSKAAYSTKDDIHAIDSSATTYDNIHGPVTAVKHLPSTTQWANEKLLNSYVSDIRNEQNGKTTSAGSIVDSFVYTEKSARLLTYQEVVSVCGSGAVSSVGYLDNCNYLIENTSYKSNYQTECWALETPEHSLPNRIYRVYGVNRNMNYATTVNAASFGIRPAIDVPISNISY